MTLPEDFRDLLAKLGALRPDQLALVKRIVAGLGAGVSIEVGESDFVSEDFARQFGDKLRIHHETSSGPLTKDRFERTMVEVLTACGHKAELARRGNPGHDLTVDGVRWSLKTQADCGIKVDELYISKFMELGKGVWVTEGDLGGLRDQMLEHMKAYDRIFSLRCLSASRARSRSRGGECEYELAEIPKSLLTMCSGGHCKMMQESRQIPKPGYCIVTVKDRVAYRLYFDGGTERKLQIKDLQKSDCVVHATWRFVTGGLEG